MNEVFLIIPALWSCPGPTGSLKSDDKNLGPKPFYTKTEHF